MADDPQSTEHCGAAGGIIGTSILRWCRKWEIIPFSEWAEPANTLDNKSITGHLERNSTRRRNAMFETLGFETLTAPQAAVWFALGLGVVFGALAQVTRFCLRRALVGEDRRQAAGVWLTALAVAVLGTQGAVAQGWIGFGDHRFMASELPVLAIVAGGLMFGAGMVLTRGCISRLTVLSGSGNLRALLAVLVFAVTAHAALKGVLAPLRTSLGSFTLSLDSAAL